jgi:polysaccharide biosynthesis protein PslH
LRLLFVCNFLPYPPTDGGRIGYLNPLKYLSRRIEIVLVSLVDSTSVGLVDKLKPYCLAIKVHQIRRSPTLALVRGLLGNPPGTAAKYYEAGFGRLIEAAAEEWKVDLVELQSLNTAAYRPWIRCAPVLLREHNVEYKVWERQAQHANTVLERIYVSMVAPRVKAYEARVAPQFERCITVSEADTNHLRKVAPAAKIEMIPSGVDTEYFFPDDGVRLEPHSMVITGEFSWRPKRHNLRVLLTEVYPRIRARLPDVTLSVVGKGVPGDLRTLASEIPGVTMTGSVADVRPYLRKAALAINYAESGGGIALKVLEAMAMRKAVLSNSLGCEGIRVKHGDNVFLADGVESFAEAAVLLLENAAIREKIAEGGHRLIQQVYAWDRLAVQFQDCYANVLSERNAAV